MTLDEGQARREASWGRRDAGAPRRPEEGLRGSFCPSGEPVPGRLGAPASCRLPLGNAPGRLSALGAVLAVLGLLAGCSKDIAPDENKAEAAKKAPLPVVTAEVRRESIAKDLVENGVVIARSQINILPKATGRILELRAEEGDKVRPGQILVRLDTPELNWQLAQQKSMLISAEANLDLAHDNLGRLQELAREGVVSQQQLKAAEAQAKVAAGQVKQNKASISLMEAQLSNSVITSPISGTVVARALEVGSMALPSTPIMTIAESGALQVKMQVPEREFAQLSEGGRLHVTSVALPGERFPARIREISEMLDPQTKLIPVKADLERSGRLKIGMNVKAMVAGRPHTGLVIPTRAILTDGAEQVVYVAAAGKARRMPVQTGVRTAEKTEVVRGLAAGDKVLVEGASFVRDGDAIAVKGGV